MFVPSISGNSFNNGVFPSKNTSGNSKPVWDGKKSFTYLEDMNKAGLDYGAQATKYYSSKTSSDEEMSVEDLKKQIGEWFSEYTLTDREPKNVVNGKHYLYIDDSQLNKMAKDPAYRAKFYGLMDREMETGKEYTLTYSDGKKKTSHCTGSIFSLCEKNKKYACADGIPYLGSCNTDAGWSTSDSHIQVRNMSFLYDNLDPAKSARKSRTMAAKEQAKQLEKKRAEKKKAEKEEVVRKEKKRIEKKKETERIAKEKIIEEQNNKKDSVLGNTLLEPAKIFFGKYIDIEI
jgi:hypothetical protein